MSTIEMETLKPCPFCGGIAFRGDVPHDSEDENAGGSFIQCTNCAASTALHFDRKENLVSSWNDRAALVGHREILLERVIRNFEITGPDEDDLVWLVLHGNGTTAKGMVNLGHRNRLVAQVALMLERDRRSALGGTNAEPAGEDHG